MDKKRPVGRPSKYEGKRLYRISDVRLQRGKRKYLVFKSISDGMTFEEFRKGNSYPSYISLMALISSGKVEAR